MDISFQGELGAYSEAAVRALFPGATPRPCATFAEALGAVAASKVDYAVIPVDNRVAGRVAGVHTLLPGSDLHIIAEHYLPIEHHLLAVPGATLADIKTVISHEQALNQCILFTHKHGITPHAFFDTAGAAAEVAKNKDKSVAAIASAGAGKLYGLASLAANIADTNQNVTRFLAFSRTPQTPPLDVPVTTTLLFTLRSVPAALYKALGGFATNGIDLTKIESYLSPDDFTSASFYVDASGHPDSEAMRHALDELQFFTTSVKVLGAYPQAKPRL